MSSADRIFEEYAAAFRDGKSDPRPYLEQASEDEREDLMEMIDLFLLRAERAEWDPDAFRGSDAERMSELLAERLLVPDGGWSEMLPRMRMRLGIKRAQVVTALARSLKAGGSDEVEKVGDYYNDMEHGNLRAAGVSRPVLESIAEIYGTTIEALRRAGEATVPTSGAGGPVYARSVDAVEQDLGMASPEPAFSRIKGEPDRIDRFFTDPDFEG
jgi:hypothetical protein